MKCPFRADAVFEYTEVKDKDGEKEYLSKAQRTEYAECYEEECPYYEYNFDGSGYCKRIGDDYQ